MALTAQNLMKNFALLCLFILASCASQTSALPNIDDPDGVYDPWEDWNRGTFERNDFIDRLLLRPMAELYRATIPPGIRDRVAGILSNMKEPVIFANDLMQGDFNKAGITVERFGINTTLGIGGMWDIAGQWGVYQQTGDFGQTLASWGVDSGPYLVVPVFGPSSVRDTVGIVVDLAMSPWQYLTLMNGTDSLVYYETASIGGNAIVLRERYIEALDNIRKRSLDYYAARRSIYYQHRNKQLGIQPKHSFMNIDASK